jgi:hypothetical protein
MKKSLKSLKIFNYTLIILIMNCGMCLANTGDIPAAPSPLVKFLIAMFGVLVSAGAIFVGLQLYKKFVLKQIQNTDDANYNTLNSPKNIKEAINMFLDKTDK